MQPDTEIDIGVHMTKITRLELLEVAKKLTGKTNISDLIKAASELETYLDIQTSDNLPPDNFEDFLKDIFIQNPYTGKIPFKPYEFQKRVIEALDAPESHYLFNTARQMGMTTLMAAYALWYAMKFPNKMVGILGPRFSQAIDFLDRVRFIYETMPKARIGTTTWNKSEIAFENGSKIIARAAQVSSLKGHSVDVLIFDSMAWLPHTICYDVWNALAPVIATADKVIVQSTPSSDEGLFHQLWINNPEFIKMEVQWHEHPDRDFAWAQKIIDQIGANQFAQEYECKFVKRQPRPTP